MANRNKYREGVVYSTENNFNFVEEKKSESRTLPPEKQSLRILLDSKKRAGKQVSLITGFVGTEDDLETLSKKLKTTCGSGGSAKDHEIIVQGDHRQKIYNFLIKEGYKVKLIG